MRPRSAVALSLLTWAILLALFVDAVMRAGADGLRWFFPLALIGSLVWAVLWRPCVIAGREDVEVRNVLSAAHLPYAAVTAVRIGAMVRLDYDDAAGRDRTVTAWNAPGVGRESPRSRLTRIHGEERSRDTAGRRPSVADWGERLRRDQERSPSAVIRRRWEAALEKSGAGGGAGADGGVSSSRGAVVRLAVVPVALVAVTAALTVVTVLMG